MTETTAPQPVRTRAIILAELKEVDAQIAAADALRADDEAKDWTAAAQKVVDQLFREFPKLKKYLDRVSDQITKTGFVMSPIGRRRVMYRVFAGIKKLVADAQRRAKNAPVQGIASEVGITAAYLVLKHMDTYTRRFKLPRRGLNTYQYQRAVHDANYGWAKYHLVIPALFVNLWCATYGVTAYYTDTFGFTFNIEPEIEIDVGASGDTCSSWDYRISELPVIMRKSLEQMVALGRLDASEIDDTMAVIFAPLVDKEHRDYLLENYPLLGLHPSTPEGQNVTDRILEMLTGLGLDPEV